MKKNIVCFIITFFCILTLIGCMAPATDSKTITRTINTDTTIDTSYKGFIITAGLYIDSTSLTLSPFKMDLNGKYIENNENTIIESNLALLEPDLWYAVTVDENTANIGYSSIPKLTEWIGEDLDKNQLNMYKGCYNTERGYCYANGCRIIGVFRSNVTGDGIKHLFDIHNLPGTNIFLNLQTPLKIIHDTAPIIKFDHILYDINSEYNEISGIITFQKAQKAMASVNVPKLANFQSSKAVLYQKINNMTFPQTHFLQNSDPYIEITNSINYYFNKNDQLFSSMLIGAVDNTIDINSKPYYSITGF